MDSRSRLARCLVLVWVVGGLVFTSAWAQRSGQTPEELEGVGLERKHGASVPSDLVFRNEQGEEVTLGRYLDGETPVVLNLMYHNCPMLCGLMLDGLTASLSSLSWTPGEKFRVLTVSFNHRETPEIARDRKDTYLRELDRAGAEEGWHFLTGNKTSIQGLTEAVGFNFKWIANEKEYAHPTALVFLSGEGTVTRYIYGMEIPRGDMRKALVEASNGAVGSPVDKVAMYCFQFDPEENTYSADAFNIMKLGSGLMALVLGVGLFLLWRREHEALQEFEDEWKDRVPAT